ncbi:glycogen debranching protein [Bacillus sp. FJAT-49711]|uniref:alpha-L-rhamnosidase-related protein n=1 Tax=Bacillus sp. FJAT-49711 TaxID=2833585 RepID=UPI001BC9971B|nr:glycogen debranching protein [Bacillus sp. FJAT-49711]MBS4219264.1 glycogen debranching protein [Bacillus sp. FJAT-49711]
MTSIKSKHPMNLYLNAGEYVKVTGAQDGYFPDFGHHVPNEMGGIWLHPIKLLDGFWLKVSDSTRNISVWSRADEFENHSWGSQFRYDHGLGHIPISITRTQFAPELEKGFIVKYEVFNYSTTETTLDLNLLARTDLRPVWFSEEIGIKEGFEDHADILSPRKLIAKDSDNEWYTIVGTDMTGDKIETNRNLYGPEFTSGNGIGVSFQASITLAPNERITFNLFIAGSYTSREDCLETYETISKHANKLMDEKIAFYQQIASQTDVEIEGETKLNDVFKWVKWNNQWLVQNVDGIGRGLTAGSPTYPWWFGCDNTYSLQGVLATGDHELVMDTIKLLRDKSREVNGNGRIVHEITTMGAVANPGNTQETAHFIAFIWEMYKWLGDKQLLSEYYEDCIQGLDWLLGEMDPDGDLLPSGYGIIEIAGLNMELIDSAVYTVKAVEALMKISLVLGDHQNHQKYKALYERILPHVEEMYWSEKHSLYCDAVAAKKDIAPNIDIITSRMESGGVSGYRDYLQNMMDEEADADKDRGWLFNKSWVILTPMEAGISSPERGRLALEQMRNEDYIGEYGTYLAGIYKQGIMTISTGVHAVAEATYGNGDAALSLLEKMLKTFSMVLPGSMNEMSPDYGCNVQAWTIYAMAVPVIKHFFGVQPEAYNKSVQIQPVIPSNWEGKEMKLRNFKVGDTSFNIQLKTEAGRLNVLMDNPDEWNLTVSWNGKEINSSEKLIQLEM